MTYHTFSYTFYEQCGPSQYSEYTDEEFYDEEAFDWDYEVSEASICRAWIEAFGSKNNTLEQNCAAVAKELMSEEEITDTLKQLEVNSIEEAIEEAKNSIEKFNSSDYAKEHNVTKVVNEYTILDYVLGDIGYYVDQDEESLTEYFEEEAHKDFIANYDY